MKVKYRIQFPSLSHWIYNGTEIKKTHSKTNLGKEDYEF